MTHKRTPLACLALLFVALLACNLPLPNGTPTVEATLTPEDATPIASQTPTEEATLTAEPTPEPRVVVFQAGNFNLYNLDGTLSETRPAAGLASWAHANQYQVVGQSIYYVDSGGSSLGGSVKRVTTSGVDDLAFTAVPNLAKLSFSVSAEETMIAWASGAWGDSELWMAQIDGSNVQSILQSDPADALEDFYVLEVYRWTQAHTPLFAWQISGIGDLLYFGYSSMYEFLPATSEIVPFYEAPIEGGMPCWSAVSDDSVYLVGMCEGGSGVPGMRERETSTGIETVLPVLPDQQQSGAAAYSPSGTKLAFAFGARGADPDDISGSIAVRNAPGEAPFVLTSVVDGYFQNIEWVNEDLLVVQGTETWVTKTYLLATDGTLTLLADGELIGLMWP